MATGRAAAMATGKAESVVVSPHRYTKDQSQQQMHLLKITKLSKPYTREELDVKTFLKILTGIEANGSIKERGLEG